MWVHEASTMQVQESNEGNKDMASTEGDLKLEGTNEEAESTGRTKDAKRQSRADLDMVRQRLTDGHSMQTTGHADMDCGNSRPAASPQA